MLVLAGPGSGKTFVMIQRVLNLIHEKQIRPEQILVISFSKASTAELKQRFQKQSKEIFQNKKPEETENKNNIAQLLKEQEKVDDRNIEIKVNKMASAQIDNNNISKADFSMESGNEVNFATFHACFFHILKETYHYTSQDIITEKQKRDILKTILLDPAYGSSEKEKYIQCSDKREDEKGFPIRKEREKGQQLQQSELTGKKVTVFSRLRQKENVMIERERVSYQEEIKNIAEKTEEYLQKISFYKNKGMKELKEKETKQFQEIYHAYNDEMHRQHKLDFDDMGLLCLQLFQTQPKVLGKWQERFQYVLIDEFQDINMIQFRIVQLLVKKHQNLFVVGDDDQAIYGFRGSNPQIMLDFEKYYPDTKKVLLETNYRCSEQIVREALKVIEQNKVRFPKDIRAYSSRNVNDNFSEDVRYQGFETCQKEYFYIGEQIKKYMERYKCKYSDIACIFRTNQDMTGLAEYFARNKIPFVMKENCNSIFRHFIALDILAYFQFFMEGKKRSDFIRIMNKPLRYLSRNALSSLNGEEIIWRELKKYYSAKKYMIANIEQLEKNEEWIQKLDLYGTCFYIRKVIGYEEYLKQYIKEQNMNWEEAKEILDFIQESTRNMRNLEEWKEYIEQYEQALKNSGEEKAGVQIITMHACKGLEYPVVFLPDCNEGKVPHKKAVSPEEIEEERRMFYVAMTRAKSHLEVLYIEDELKKHLQVSRFLKKSFKPAPGFPPVWTQ